jgi:protein subunit release factor B
MISAEKQQQLSERMRRLGIHEDDLVEKFVGGSGPGGQKINRTASRVYLKHIPSGIEIQCQAGRSQTLNRHQARTLLCEHLEERARRERLEKQRLRAKERFRKRRRSKAQKKRLQAEKTKRSEKKQRRGKVRRDEN